MKRPQPRKPPKFKIGQVVKLKWGNQPIFRIAVSRRDDLGRWRHSSGHPYCGMFDERDLRPLTKTEAGR